MLGDIRTDIRVTRVIIDLIATLNGWHIGVNTECIIIVVAGIISNLINSLIH